MKIVIVLALLALGAFAQIPETHMNCLPQVDFAFFDLRALEQTNTSNFTAYFNPITKGDSITFSLCQPVLKDCSKTRTHAALEIVDKACYPIAGVRPSDASFKMINEKNRSEGVKISFTGGIDNSNFTLNVKCGKSNVVGLAKRINNKVFEVNMFSPAGCPTLDVKPIYNYISGEAWVLKVALMIVGVLLTFLGRQLVKPALFTLGFGAVFILSTYGIFSYFITATTPVWGLWTLLAVCVLVALFVGYLAAKLESVGYFCCGLALGYAFGNFIMMSVLVHTNIQNPDLVMYGIMGVSGLIFGVAMVQYRDILMIITTSLFGALMVSRTFLSSVASLPSEPQILEMFKNGVPIPPIVWGYLALYVTLAGLGIWVQKSRKSPEWDSKAELMLAQGPYGYYQRA